MYFVTPYIDISPLDIFWLRMAEADQNGVAWKRDQWADHELPAISSARNSAWSSKDSLPDQNLPSRGVSVFLIIIAAIESVLTSGIVFGWAPLQLLLQEEGIYGDSCANGPPCEEQAVRLDLIYTAATSAFCFCVWPTGLVRCARGPLQPTCCTSCALLRNKSDGASAAIGPLAD
jgi:hypothetical protein